MQFGFFTILPFHESGTEAEHCQQTLEKIELADQLGFTEVWLGEHHFSRHGLVSGLYSWMGAAVGAHQARADRVDHQYLPIPQPHSGGRGSGHAGGAWGGLRNRRRILFPSCRRTP